MSEFWKGILIGSLIFGIIASLLSAYIKEYIDKLIQKFSLLNISKSIKKLEYELQKIDSYRENINSLFLDLFREIFFMIMGSMLLITYVIIIYIAESKTTVVIFGLLGMLFLFMLINTYTSCMKLISKVRRYDKYTEKINNRILELKSMSEIKQLSNSKNIKQN